MGEKFIPEIDGILRRHMIRVPKEIDSASGIRIFGKLIRSIVFTTDVPVFCGVGGGTTTGHRVVNLAEHAEYQGAVGVVLNAPTSDDTIVFLKECIDIPIVITVVSDKTDIQKRLDSGVSIFNVSAASRTPEIVRNIRKDYPTVPIMATGGPTPESILETIEAGANAITYTPSSTSDIFKSLMNKYRAEH